MRRLWHIWAAFGLAAAVAVGGMWWLSLAALRLDRAEAEGRLRLARAEAERAREAEFEERVRLALWRMDSALTPLVARESGHGYLAYTPLYRPERAYNRYYAEYVRGEVQIPSPLLGPSPKRVLLYFQFGPDGKPVSPQAPESNPNDLVQEHQYATQEQIETARSRLGQLAAVASRDRLLAVLPAGTPRPPRPAVRRVPMPQGQQAALQQKERSTSEQQARDRAAQRLRIVASASQIGNRKGSQAQPSPPPEVVEGVMLPVWAGGELLLARRVAIDGKDHVQGCWLDWPGIRRSLLAEVRDLLPEAALEPVPGDSPNGGARMLAILPVRLVPGAVPAGEALGLSAPLFEEARGLSPICIALLIAWGCVAVAVVAVGVLLVGAVGLSERRGAFVSAVTHELRTPLTTFQMYTEMLTSGMVADAAKRRRYLTTLRTESGRLSHLVENVLAYARLERSRGRGQIETLPLGDVLDRVTGRLAERAARAEMTLEVEADDDALAASVRVDTSVVEQILLNLVDNACKYAASASDRRIHLRAARLDGSAALLVGDHGPGISAKRRRLFRPFSKSARDAAHSAPGVGLGLALSRRLARDQGGELRLVRPTPEGAWFALELPTA